jgi:hypothetical protein
MSSGVSKSIPGQLIQFVSRFEKQVVIAGAFCDAQWVRYVRIQMWMFCKAVVFDQRREGMEGQEMKQD